MWRPGICPGCMFETPKTRVINCFSLFSRQLRRSMPSICSMWWIICITITWLKKTVALMAPWRRCWVKTRVFRTLAVLVRNFLLQPQRRTRFPQDQSSSNLVGHHRCARVPPELGSIKYPSYKIFHGSRPRRMARVGARQCSSLICGAMRRTGGHAAVVEGAVARD